MKKTIGVILFVVGVIIIGFMIFNTHIVNHEPMTFFPVINFKLHVLFCALFFVAAEFGGIIFYFDWF